jgi:hypothetical protein
MAETSTNRYQSQAGEDLKDQWKLPSYDKEKRGEKQELSNDQIRQVKDSVKEAQLKSPHVVCERDQTKYLVYLERDCKTNADREYAITNLPEHLKKKAEHLQQYEESIKKHFSSDGRLNEEGEKLLEEYYDMTGEERKEAAKKLNGVIEARIEEKKNYQELLEESPHFSEDGKLTPEAEKLFQEYQLAAGPRKEDLKRQLLNQIRRLNKVEKECEQTYTKANEFYERGKFISGEMFLEHIIGLCDEYPDSPRFQVIKDWNKRDLENMKDHTEKDRAIQKTMMLRDTFEGVEDIDTAIRYSTKLTQQTEHFLSFTTNRSGAEVPRKEKYQSQYLKKLQQDADHEHRVLLAMEKGAVEDQEDGHAKVKQAYTKAMTTTAEGDEATVVAASLQEELEKTDVHHRTDDVNEVLSLDTAGDRDILHLSEDQLEDSAEEGKPEIVMDLKRDNRHRAQILKRADLDSDNDTAVARDGRLLTTGAELKKAAGQETQKFTNQFIKQEKHKGEIDEAYLDSFQELARRKAETGQIGEHLTDIARDPSRVGIRLGKYYEGDKRENAEEMFDLIQRPPQKDQKESKIINFAEELKQRRQEVRRAA